jgi:hypothetical protein
MNWKKILITGVISGIIFGLSLFIGGAITGWFVYGEQMAPEGKFEPEQMNAFYFIWTKIVIGIFFGFFFLVIHEILPLSKRITSVAQGILSGFILWLVISLWDLSHPLVYESIYNSNQLFWLLYTLWGFLAYGAAVGYILKRFSIK